MTMKITVKDIQQAHGRISPYIHRTPIFESRALNKIIGCELLFKAENFQKIGAFKARGACNAVFSMDEPSLQKGVITHSSGNHGAALARAAQLRGIPAWIVVPENALSSKKAAIRHYGADIIECASTLDARESSLAALVKDKQCQVVPPYDDALVIAGQGTAGLELTEQVDHLDCIVAPVGGGGLLAGCVLAADGKIAVYGAEPAGADDAYRSFQAGVRVNSHKPTTIADGLRTVLGVSNFEIIQSSVKDILLVSEDEIIDAMALLWTRLKQVVEPSSAVTLAAVLRNPDVFRGKRVGLMLTGGNVDIGDLPF